MPHHGACTRDAQVQEKAFQGAKKICSVCNAGAKGPQPPAPAPHSGGVMVQTSIPTSIITGLAGGCPTQFQSLYTPTITCSHPETPTQHLPNSNPTSLTPAPTSLPHPATPPPVCPPASCLLCARPRLGMLKPYEHMKSPEQGRLGVGPSPPAGSQEQRWHVDTLSPSRLLFTVTHLGQRKPSFGKDSAQFPQLSSFLSSMLSGGDRPSHPRG